MSGVKIYVTVAAFLLIGLAQSCLGACPQGTSMSKQSAEGEWCVFCPDGKGATQSFTDAGVSCKCGKDDCSVTLAGKPSTLGAYQKAISDSSPVESAQEIVSSTSEEVSSQETTSSSSSGSTATTTTTTTETTSSHGVMAVVSVMAMMMVAVIA